MKTVRIICPYFFCFIYYFIYTKATNTEENIPRNIRVTKLTATSVFLQWEPPEKLNGPVMGYNIYYTTKSTIKTQPWQIEVTGNNRHAVINNLIPYFSYVVKIQTISNEELGPFSSLIPMSEENDIEPRNVIMKKVNRTGLNVKWTPLKAGILGYQIIVQEIATTCDVTDKLMRYNISAVDTSEYNVTNLQPATAYYVHVASISSQGNVAKSPAQFVLTDNDVPTKPNTSIEILQDVPHLIVQIKWTRPYQTYGTLLRYRLRYGSKQSNQAFQEIKMHPAINRTTVPYLDYNKMYEFRLAAGNKIGWSEESVATFNMPEGVPTAPPKKIKCTLQHLTTIAISWNPPSSSSTNGKIVHYGFEFHGSTEQAIKEHNVTDLQVTLSHLNEHTDYKFRIRAYTLKGPGPWSKSITSRTSGRPRHIQAVATSQHSVEVWWDEMSHSQDATGYNVFYTQNHAENREKWNKNFIPFTNSTELYELESNATYIIVLQILTKQGNDFFSDPISVQVTPTDVPTQVTAQNITANSMVLKWKPPKKLIPIKYKISYNTYKEFYDSDGIFHEITAPPITEFVNANRTELEIHDLHPFMTCQINISAVPHNEVYRPPVRIKVTTEMTAPKSFHRPFTSGSRKTNTISVNLFQASEENGIISHHLLIVVPDEKAIKSTDDFSIEELTSEGSTKLSPYIAAKFPRLSANRIFDLGDENVYNGFTNRRLVGGVKYRIFLRAVVATYKTLYTSSNFSESFSLDKVTESCHITFHDEDES